jgi:hypothetical protein
VGDCACREMGREGGETDLSLEREGEGGGGWALGAARHVHYCYGPHVMVVVCDSLAQCSCPGAVPHSECRISDLEARRARTEKRGSVRERSHGKSSGSCRALSLSQPPLTPTRTYPYLPPTLSLTFPCSVFHDQRARVTIARGLSHLSFASPGQAHVAYVSAVRVCSFAARLRIAGAQCARGRVSYA